LAISLARAGRDVLLVDGDTQGLAQTAIAIRTDARRLPTLACAQFPDGRVLRDQVRLQAPRYQDVLVDAGGRDSGALRAALVLSDVLLIPFMPRSTCGHWLTSPPWSTKRAPCGTGWSPTRC
jgi:chromosome partitioning protein